MFHSRQVSTHTKVVQEQSFFKLLSDEISCVYANVDVLSVMPAGSLLAMILQIETDNKV